MDEDFPLVSKNKKVLKIFLAVLVVVLVGAIGYAAFFLIPQPLGIPGGKELKNDVSSRLGESQYKLLLDSSTALEIKESMQNHFSLIKNSNVLKGSEQTIYIPENHPSCAESNCISEFLEMYRRSYGDGVENVFLEDSIKLAIYADDKQAVVNSYVDFNESGEEPTSNISSKAILSIYMIKKNDQWLVGNNNQHAVGLDLIALGIPHDDFDSDGDGYLDSYENCQNIKISNCTAQTNPNNPDTDGDGWWDGIEVFVTLTSPVEKNETIPESIIVSNNKVLFDPGEDETLNFVQNFRISLEYYKQSERRYPLSPIGTSELGGDLRSLTDKGWGLGRPLQEGVISSYIESIPENKYSYFSCDESFYIVQFDIDHSVNNIEAGVNFATKDDVGKIINFSNNTFSEIPEQCLDQDRDGLSAYFEEKYKTDKNNPDSDDDGHLDGQEVVTGYDPSQPATVLATKAPVTSQDHIRGNANAQITLLEYCGFEGPYCTRHQKTLEQLLSLYAGDIRLVYRHLPLNSLFSKAQKAAEASECAAEQGKFWEYHDILFDNQSNLSVEDLKSYASQLNLNQSKFGQCLDTSKYAGKISEQTEEALASGVIGTPGTFVNDQLVQGAEPLSHFQEIIDKLLK